MAGQSDFFSEKSIYCIDTSTIIVLRQFYPADVFETLHQLIISIFKSGKILVVNSVLEELKPSDPTKMPYICNHEGVKCVNFIEFLKQEKIKI